MAPLEQLRLRKWRPGWGLMYRNGPIGVCVCVCECSSTDKLDKQWTQLGKQWTFNVCKQVRYDRFDHSFFCCCYWPYFTLEYKQLKPIREINCLTRANSNKTRRKRFFCVCVGKQERRTFSLPSIFSTVQCVWHQHKLATSRHWSEINCLRCLPCWLRQ